MHPRQEKKAPTVLAILYCVPPTSYLNSDLELTTFERASIIAHTYMRFTQATLQAQ